MPAEMKANLLDLIAKAKADDGQLDKVAQIGGRGGRGWRRSEVGEIGG